MNYYREITFAAPSASLSNFPVLVRIKNSRMKNRISSTQGYDVAFQQQNGTALPFELDFYDSSTGTGAWWVQIPQISSSNPTTIRMVYGDSSITTDQSSPTTVWSGYLAVYHFNSTDTSQQFNSATGTYGTWSEQPQLNKTAAFVSGGVTGRMLSVTQRFYTYQPSTLTCPTESLTDNLFNSVTIMETLGYFGTPNYNSQARIASLTQSYINNTKFKQYEAGWYRTIPYTERALEYMNFSWRKTDSAFLWHVNGQTETGTTIGTSVASPISSVTCLFCYNAEGTTQTYKVDEIRVRQAFVAQADAEYEHNILMNHSNYVTYEPEYYSNGTLVRDQITWKEPRKSPSTNPQN